MSLEDVVRSFRLIRSKNAGPFMITIDLFFEDHAAYQALRSLEELTAASIAALYGVDVDRVSIHDVPSIDALKISLPRRIAGGTPGDTDVTGGQQYGPLVERLARADIARRMAGRMAGRMAEGMAERMPGQIAGEPRDGTGD
jgi:hypothetical protein